MCYKIIQKEEQNMWYLLSSLYVVENISSNIINTANLRLLGLIYNK